MKKESWELKIHSEDKKQASTEGINVADELSLSQTNSYKNQNQKVVVKRREILPKSY